ADPLLLFWRFETSADVPAGFGGLEIHGTDALLRCVVTLPQLRRIGMGSAIVSALEAEARARQCRRIYLLTAADAKFFRRLGYRTCRRAGVPEPIRRSPQFAALRSATATAMVKLV